jgi:hypothetical protein
LFNINTVHICTILRICTYRNIIFRRHSKQLIKINCVVSKSWFNYFWVYNDSQAGHSGQYRTHQTNNLDWWPYTPIAPVTLSSYKFWSHLSSHTQYHLFDVTTTEFVECYISLLLQINLIWTKELWKHNLKNCSPWIWDDNMDTNNCHLTRSVIIPLKTAKINV